MITLLKVGHACVELLVASAAHTTQREALVASQHQKTSGSPSHLFARVHHDSLVEVHCSAQRGLLLLDAIKLTNEHVQ